MIQAAVTKEKKEYPNYEGKANKVKHWVAFFVANSSSVLSVSAAKYCQLHALPSSSFSRHLVLLGYTQLISEKRDKAEVFQKAQILADIVKEKTKTRTVEASKSCCYLMDNEEKSFITVCTLLCELGYGISKPELMRIINDYIHEDSCIQEVEHATKKLVSGMLKHNPHLACFIHEG